MVALLLTENGQEYVPMFTWFCNPNPRGMSVFITNFEDISGAILSRSEKSKVMDLGPWKGRQDWPLDWLKVVNTMKIFGFQVTPSYKQSLQMSWDACLAGFRKTIMS